MSSSGWRTSDFLLSSHSRQAQHDSQRAIERRPDPIHKMNTGSRNPTGLWSIGDKSFLGFFATSSGVGSGCLIAKFTHECEFCGQNAVDNSEERSVSQLWLRN